MSKKQTRGTNTMTESLGGNLFRKTNFDEPAHEHARLPVVFVSTAAEPTFEVQPENDLVIVDNTAHTSTVDMPSASGLDGVSFTIKQSAGTDDTTIVPFGSELIDGGASVTLSAAGDSVTLTAVDNDEMTGWVITAQV